MQLASRRVANVVREVGGHKEVVAARRVFGTALTLCARSRINVKVEALGLNGLSQTGNILCQLLPECLSVELFSHDKPR
ncbi:hypothetical protein ACK100_004398 [Salmonella enterica]